MKTLAALPVTVLGLGPVALVLSISVASGSPPTPVEVSPILSPTIPAPPVASMIPPPRVEDPPSREDFEIYKRALGVRNKAVQAAALEALTAYPDGFDILLEFVRKNLGDRNAEVAANALEK
jgi:hypothetical protein